MGGGKGRETLTYSKNGNIKSLIRTENSGAIVDDLTYHYAGNRLA